MSNTIWRYMITSYALVFLYVLAGVHLIVFFAKFLELLTRSVSVEFDFSERALIALLETPNIAIMFLPLCALLACMWHGAKLTRSSEIPILQNLGMSIWRIMLPVMVCNFMIAVVFIVALNPLITTMSKQSTAIQSRIFSYNPDFLSLSASGMWLRQNDNDGANNISIIYALRASPDATRLFNVSFLRFSADGEPIERLEASRANLEDNRWRLHDVIRYALNERPLQRQDVPVAYVGTDLTSTGILDSFAAPNTISIWKLPSFINMLDRSGFSSARHRLALHSILVLPIFLVAMGATGAAYSMRHQRFGGLGMMALLCIITGFSVFFLTEVIRGLGATQTIPPYIAAWSVPIAILMLAGALMMHMEEV